MAGKARRLWKLEIGSPARFWAASKHVQNCSLPTAGSRMLLKLRKKRKKTSFLPRMSLFFAKNALGLFSFPPEG